MIDPAIAGRDLGVVTFPVERSKLRELAHSLQDDDPVWHDAEAAGAAGFDGVPTPPTVTTLADHWRPGGAPAMAAAIGADLRRVLHGEAAWEHCAPIRPGDEITARQRVADVSTRQGGRGGTMTIVVVETTFDNQDGECVAIRHDSLIETEAQA